MNMQLDSHIKAAFDEIVAQTPELGDTPSVDLVPLTAAGGRQPHHWMLLTAAAAVVVIGAAGLIALRSDGSDTNDTPAAAQPPATTDGASTSPPATSPTPTTMQLDPAPIIQPGSVVCVSAGGSPRAMGLCVEELGGPVVDGTPSEDSFVMPVDPDNPQHVTATQHVGDAVGLPVRELDPQILSTGTAFGSEVTTYLVIGSSDAPYAPPADPGHGTPTTVAGAAATGVSSVEQTYMAVAGDTVESIAGHFGFPSSQLDLLVELNGWANANVTLSPGDIVRIPPGAIIPTND